jgi:ATP-dependent helicase/nuclease subunit B
MSLEQWWQHCYEASVLAGMELPNLLTAQQELELWQASIVEHPLSAALLRPRGAAQLARDAYRNMLLWQIDWHTEPQASAFNYDADASLLLEWVQAYERQIERKALAIVPQLVAQLAQQNPCETIVLAEFDEVSPLYRSALLSQTENLLDYAHNAPAGQHRIVACEDNDSELLQAASWAKQISLQQPDARVGILVPRLQQCRQTVQRTLQQVFTDSSSLGRKSLPINFSAGVSLSSCGVVRSALALLKLPVEDSALPALVQLLHSRYRDGTELALEQQLIQRLYRRGRERVPVSLLRHECARIKSAQGTGLKLGQQLLEISQQRDLRERHLPSQWAALFSTCLENLGWPGSSPLDSEEYQQVEHWQSALKQMNELDRVCQAMTYNSAQRHLQQICKEAVFQPQTEDAQIQVLGLLEAAGLQFDHLWLCGMSSTQWPPIATPNPFVPAQIQRELSMPHANAERELHYARGLLRQFIACGADITASYARFDAGVPQAASPLLVELADSQSIVEKDACPQQWLDLHALSQTEHISDSQAPIVADTEIGQIRGGSGLIADQSQCPFRAFAHHRLRARALPDLSVALTAAERGSILHDALYQLWGELSDSASLRATSGSEREQIIQRAANSAVDGFRQRYPQTEMQSLLDVELQRLQPLLKTWLEVEEQREEFQVIAREEGLTIALGKLSLELRIDRIDQLPSGRKMIIDYKSGNAEIRYWAGQRPQQPQLPLYAQAMGEEVEAVSFAVVSGKDCSFKGMGRATGTAGVKDDIGAAVKNWDVDLQDWDALQEYWSYTMQELAQDFLDGEAQVDPVDIRNTCTWCGLESLCRIQP